MIREEAKMAVRPSQLFATNLISQKKSLLDVPLRILWRLPFVKSSEPENECRLKRAPRVREWIARSPRTEPNRTAIIARGNGPYQPSDILLETKN